MPERAQTGKVYIVGAGPGDPALLTMRAREVIDSADAIVYHSRALRELLPQDAKERGHPEIYFVGEPKDGKRPSREAVNELLSSLARSGRNVVRLLRGDPLLMNPGSEEAQHLNDCAIEFEIVPGVAEGIAAAAHAGIPLTHGDLSGSVTFLDNRRFSDKSSLAKTQARSADTIVIGPGVDSLGEIAAALIAGGMSRDVPAATIQHPGTARQRIVTGSLGDIDRATREAGIVGRAVTIVGYTVVLGFELGWLDRRPLFGKRVALADPPSASGRLGPMLRDLGAEVIDMPEASSQRVHIDWVHDIASMLQEYQWLVFVGTEGVAVFWEQLLAANRDSRSLVSRKVSGVGGPTVRALLERGIVVDVTPAAFDVDAISDALRSRDDLAGTNVLVIAGEDVDDALVNAIREAGAAYTVIRTSRSEIEERALLRWRQRLSSHRPDAIAFTSARSVRRFAETVGEDEIKDWRGFSIGGSTSAALRDSGIEVGGEAKEPTLASIVETIRRALE